MRPPRTAVLSATLTVLFGLSLTLSTPANAAPSPDSHQVTGALRGAAAVAAAGDAADVFRTANTQRRDAVQSGAAINAQLHNWWGVFPAATWTGMTATHTLNPNFRLSN